MVLGEGAEGIGRGMGIGRGIEGGVLSSSALSPQPSMPQQEIEMLEAQLQTLAQQLAEIQHQIEELEKKRK